MKEFIGFIEEVEFIGESSENGDVEEPQAGELIFSVALNSGLLALLEDI